MKNKKYILIFVFLFILILVVGWYVINKMKGERLEQIEEYVPEEEILEENNRKYNSNCVFPKQRN